MSVKNKTVQNVISCYGCAFFNQDELYCKHFKKPISYINLDIHDCFTCPRDCNCSLKSEGFLKCEITPEYANFLVKEYEKIET